MVPVGDVNKVVEADLNGTAEWVGDGEIICKSRQRRACSGAGEGASS